jgi:peptidoglycan/LPS O-acetylase OafA/YrhL
MILAGAVLKQRERLGDNVFVRTGKLLGDASYALYLCHPIVMSAFAVGWFALGFNNRLNPYVGVGISLVLAVIASVLVYRWFERPLTRTLQKRVLPIEPKRPTSELEGVSQRA